MDILSIILIAIGLAMDCFAVSISKGMCVKKFYFFPTLKLALLFGLFQGIMPFIGYFISNQFVEQIKIVDHWIAFILLGFIGVRMLIEAYKEDEKDCEENDVKKTFQMERAFYTGNRNKY